MTRVAIACQGGGSHTAFAGGALQRLLPAATAGDRELVGLSGTSGGAVCATLAWAGLVQPDETPGALLGEYWDDVAARGPERIVNSLSVAGLAAETMGVPVPDTGPFRSLGRATARRWFRELLTDHVDFEAATARHERGPALLVSAVEVETGEYELFREDELRPEMVLASAAVPGLFGAVEVSRADGDGSRGTYWDGLFAKNPPVKDFATLPDVPDPDEVWVVQINPRSRSGVPRTRQAIADRRDELSANTALEQEIEFVEHVSDWAAADHAPDHYTSTEVRRVELGRDLNWSSKLDRSPRFLRELFQAGRERADAVLARA